MVDRPIVEALNRAVQHQPLRLLALILATYLLALPIAARFLD